MASEKKKKPKSSDAKAKRATKATVKAAAKAKGRSAKAAQTVKPAKKAGMKPTKAAAKTKAPTGKAARKPKAPKRPTEKAAGRGDSRVLAVTAPEPARGADKNLLADRFWRLVAMVAFALLIYFALIPFLILAAMQFGVILMTGERNREVHQLLARLLKYIHQCLGFIAYGTEEMPFPFGPLPPAD